MTLDLTSEITVFVTTIGDEPNFTDCMNHLRNQTSLFTLNVIKNVAPMSAAFQNMIDSCLSPYYVQVDEDMLLHPSAIEYLYGIISRSHKSVCIVCAPLWDCEINMPIYGAKIYRHSIVRKFPYANKASCEVEQITRMNAAGFHILYIPLINTRCIGEHGKNYTNASIFNRWERLFEKHRRTGHIAWIEPWPKMLLERYIRTRDDLHLFALLGAISGIVRPIPEDLSIDYRICSDAFAQLKEYFDISSASKPDSYQPDV